MRRLGDITSICGGDVPPANVVIGGSPCQDLSTAGKRKGLAGERSGLFLEQIRLVKEMRDADIARGRFGRDIRPRWLVWENVPGAFSSNHGEDFRAVLEETIRIADPEAPDVPLPPKGRWPLADAYYGDGWSVAYRVLDAQFWGVPQRRRRIALVADFGGRTAPEILFVREGLSGHPYTGKTPWEALAVPSGAGVGETSLGFGPAYCDRGDGIRENFSYTPGTADRPGVVSFALRMRAGCEGGGKGALVQVEKSGTLGCGNDQVLFQCAVLYENHAQDSRVSGPLEVSPTVSQYWGTGGNNVPLVMATGQARAEIGEGLCPTLNCDHEAPIVFDKEVYNSGVGATGGHYISEGGPAPTQRTEHPPGVCVAGIVRRLTPLECERLQGFPDGWTDIAEFTDKYGITHKTEGWMDESGKWHKDADSPRYKALGNSIALPPWAWVLARLSLCAAVEPTMASLFDGIGGFPLIWEALNGQGSCLWASEIEPFCIAVTKERFGEG